WQHERVGDRSNWRDDVEIGGHHRERPHLRGAGDRERLAYHARQAAQALLDRRGEEDDRGRARERQLETNVPCKLGTPGEHRGGCGSERGAGMGGSAVSRGGDGRRYLECGEYGG